MKKFDPFRDGEKFTTIGFGGGGISVDGEMLQNSRKSSKLLNYAKNAAKIVGTGALLYGIYNLPFVNKAFVSFGNEALNNINFVGDSIFENVNNFGDGMYQAGVNITKDTFKKLDDITKIVKKGEKIPKYIIDSIFNPTFLGKKRSL